MKVFAVVALLVASAMAGTHVRIEGDSYSHSVADLPSFSSGYSAPLEVRSAYSAPVEIRSAYAAPVEIRSAGYGGYDAPLLVRNFIPITSYNQEIRAGLSDRTEFSTGNGIHIQEQTQVVPGTRGSYRDEYGQMIESDSSLVKSGAFSYTSADGVPIALSWTADENGFHAAGAHLPTPPPMPLELVEAYRAALAAPAYSSYSAPLEVRSAYAAPVEIRSAYAAPSVVVRSNAY